jgi:metallophosphoesterase superfamily enzyme
MKRLLHVFLIIALISINAFLNAQSRQDVNVMPASGDMLIGVVITLSTGLKKDGKQI